jgi:uncharacterized membrane protein
MAISPMAATAISAPSSVAPRLQSVDALRGAIMMLMAIDHIRDYVARSAMQFLPTACVHAHRRPRSFFLDESRPAFEE